MNGEHPIKLWLGIGTAIVAFVAALIGAAWGTLEWSDGRYANKSDVDAHFSRLSRQAEADQKQTQDTLKFNRLSGELGRAQMRAETLQDRVDELSSRLPPRPPHEAISLRRVMSELEQVNRDIRIKDRQLNEMRTGR